MTFEEIYAQLQALGTEQNRKIYRRHGASGDLFGVSFANFSQLKKQLTGRGKDAAHAHALAQQLWATRNFDAQLLATMIADPRQLTEVAADAWAADTHCHMLADALATLVGGTQYAQGKVREWTSSPGEMHQRIGYSLLNGLALRSSALPDSFFEPFIARIEAGIAVAPNRAKEAMNNCLIGMGSRNETLRQQVEAAADRIGPVSIDHGDTSCQTFEVRPYLAKVWARKTKSVPAV
ncbi:DNA alkylation repair protein [Hymenobacter koreensis]|uniref:DNA alkylation repair protein n=1 Tax=Hymenobacter koreensis TaxID=1084523 RepID=A0ABP8J577_9BACT